MVSQPRRGPSTPPSGGLGSGILSRPRTARRNGPRLPVQVCGSGDHDDMDDLDDLSELALTQPQLPSVPRLPTPPPPPPPPRAAPPPPPPPPAPFSRRLVSIAADFSGYMCGQDWIHDEALAPLAVETRMRVFSALSRVYLPVLEATGRTESPGRMQF